MFRWDRKVNISVSLWYSPALRSSRNGGHINPPLYHDYAELEKTYGEETAKRMIKFRLAHRQEMQRVVEKEEIVKESQIRETEHVDVFRCPKKYAEAKENLRTWKAAMPEESSPFGFADAEDAITVSFKYVQVGQSARDYYPNMPRVLMGTWIRLLTFCPRSQEATTARFGFMRC